MARRGLVGYVTAGKARRGGAWNGQAGFGWVWYVTAGLAWLGAVWLGMSRQVWHG
jgi:hypothetical protein